VVRNLHALNNASAMLGLVGDDEPGRWVHHRLSELNSDNRAAGGVSKVGTATANWAEIEEF